MSTWMAIAIVASCITSTIVEIVFFVLRRRLARLEREHNEAFIARRDEQLAEQRAVIDDFHADMARLKAEFEARR